MSDIKFIKVRSVNSTMKLLYSDKLTWAEWFIRWRSFFTHMQIQFSDRYGGISHICTKAGGHNCCFFKMVGYTTAYQWSTILIPVTAAQEARIFKEACRMANVGPSNLKAHLTLEPQQIISEEFTVNNCIYGLNAIKYDTFGLGSFISKWDIIKMSDKRQVCNETVGLLVMVEWPDVFCTYRDSDTIEFNRIPPHKQLPDATHFMIQHYFENLTVKSL